MMRFEVLSVTPAAVGLCFVDSALIRPGDITRPSYDARSALRVSRDEASRWTARELAEGLPGCSNDPRAR